VACKSSCCGTACSLLFEWVDESSAVVSSDKDLDALRLSSDSDDDMDSARCNRRRKFGICRVCETFRMAPMVVD
jgi:hypothetical protein